jgi:hypothetical protein
MVFVQTRLARSHLASPGLSVLWQPLSRRPIKRVSDRQYKSFVMWRGTFEAEFSDTSVGPVFFARGGMANQTRSSGREA